MGEIKSTLDLVMEKTKNLNLSQAEKQDQKNKEMESRLRGLVQKFQDEIISIEKLKAEYQVVCKDFSITDTQHEQLLNVLCARIELGKDNQALLDLLAQIADTRIDGITSVLQDFDTATQKAAAAQSQIVRDEFTRSHHISGSAVMPNLESNPAWRSKVEEIRAEFETKLNQEKANLLA
jgi:ribosomal protein S20